LLIARSHPVVEMKLALSLCGVVIALGLLGTSASAQGTGAATIHLLNPRASSGPIFEQVESVRELPDGRVVVLDRRDRERHLSWIDLSTGSVTNIGRAGGGPGEYQRPRALVSVGADRTIVTDLALGRWLVLDGVSPRATLGPDSVPVREMGATLLGGDTAGQVLALRGVGARVPLPALAHAESLLVLLGSIDRARVDTVARLLGTSAKLHRFAFADTLGTNLAANPMLVHPQAALALDAWLAVAFAAPFRVDWRRPDGTWIRGSVLDAGNQAPTAADKRLAILARWGGVPAAATIRLSIFDDWPSSTPAFLEGALLVTADGCLVVRRFKSAAPGVASHDVIDRRAQRVAILEIPSTHRLVGFGRRGAYATTENADGLISVSRFELPARLC
jgi:hypothetical protein